VEGRREMKVLQSLFLIIGLFGFAGKEVLAEESLQAKIADTPVGGTLHIAKGVYQEPIILDKPIFVVAEDGVLFTSCSNEPIITIRGQNIGLKNIKIASCETDEAPFSIQVSGNAHKLEDITISSSKLAIMVDNTHNSVFQNIKISGEKQENAIEVWGSSNNTFEKILIDHVQDGFYAEDGSYNKFFRNTITDSRYGIHVMYSDYIVLEENVSKRNFTGVMIMQTANAFIANNTLVENNQNVNAQGLLLYDVHQSTITNNTISDNRVGLFIENSNHNKIEHNEVRTNYVGVQMSHVENNMIENNLFISNVTEGQAKNGKSNLIRNNFWDAAARLDTDGDGKSNLSYKVDPYFIALTKEVPEYQLFFQHPGMLLLQKMLKSPEHLLVSDTSPLMEIPLQNTTNMDIPSNFTAWLMSITMILASIFILYVGRKKL
jgi:nitrous oxidase accessory protein